MADTKELDFGQMLASDPEYMDIGRRRAIAQALAAATLKNQPTGGEFRRSPLAAIADFMALRNSQEKVNNFNAQEAALYKKHKDLESQGVESLNASQPGSDDQRKQLALAMASQYPNLRRLGETMFKTQGENFRTSVDALKDRLDPNSVINAGGQVNNLRTAPPMSAPKLTTQQGPNGPVSWIEAPKLNGETGVHTLPAGATASVNMGDKPALDTEEQIGKHFAPGGKGYEEGQQAQRSLASTQEMLKTLMSNPAMGTGAEVIQGMRKLAETLSPGISEGLSANTEQAKMQLKQAIITQLGGKLGGGVSNEDVKLLNEALGSIDSDPTALRRVLLLNMKAQMRQLATLAQGARTAEEMPAFVKRGLNLSNPFNFDVDVSGIGGDPFAPMQGVAAPRLPPRVGPSGPSLPPGVRAR